MGKSLREVLDEAVSNGKAAEKAKATLDLLDELDRAEQPATTEQLQQAIAAHEAVHDYDGAARYKLTLGRLAAAKEAREGRRG